MQKVEFSCSGQPKEYKIASRKKLPYVDGVIKWHLNNFTEDMTRSEQLMFFYELSNKFTVRNFPLITEPTENKEEAYFQVYWIGKDGWAHKEGKRIFKSPYNFRKGVLAVCYPRDGRKTDGLLLMNDEYFFALRDSEGKIGAKKVVEHEWAHGYGLDHTRAANDIMREEYNPENYWTQDSALGLFEINKEQRIEEMARNKETRLLLEEIEKRRPLELNQNKKEIDGRIYAIIAIIISFILGAIT